LVGIGGALPPETGGFEVLIKLCLSRFTAIVGGAEFIQPSTYDLLPN
jgi:hypothetical protein